MPHQSVPTGQRDGVEVPGCGVVTQQDVGPTIQNGRQGGPTRSACPGTGGWAGVVTRDVVNTLTSLAGDPNVSIHEGKAFVCKVEKA